jgi:hypothetical protein
VLTREAAAAAAAAASTPAAIAAALGAKPKGLPLVDRLQRLIEEFKKANATQRIPPPQGVPLENPFAKANAAAAAASRAKAGGAAAGGGKAGSGGGGGGGGKAAAAAGGAAAQGGAALVAGAKGVVQGAAGKLTPSSTASSSGDRSRRGSFSSTEDAPTSDGVDAALPAGHTSVSIRLTVGSGASARSAPEVAWEDAALCIPHESFAAVTKGGPGQELLMGYPSYFSAPLFRRIKRAFPAPSPTPPEAWALEADKLCKEATALAAYHTALAASAGGEGVAARSGSAGRGGIKGQPPQPALSISGSGIGKKLPPAPTFVLPAASVRCLAVGVPAAAPCQGAASDRDNSGSVTLLQVMAWWLTEVEPYDEKERFFRLLRCPRANAITPADLAPFMTELLTFHPGLEFLHNTPEFQDKYSRTVIARMFFEWDPAGKGTIPLSVLRASNLVQAFQEVDVQDDINSVNEYFSYEHFYVLYCKFWELDSDHDQFINRADLERMTHINPLALDRVYAQCGKPFLGAASGEKRMGYEDFINFFMALEDKTMPSSLR